MYKELITKTAEALFTKGIVFAITGGIAATVYRQENRFTQDLNVSVTLSEESNFIELRKQLISILNGFDYEVSEIRKAQLEGGPLFAIKRKSTPVCIIAGRSKIKNAVGIDFILPELPWVEEAVKRAQSNLVNYNFGCFPTLTVEDIIISKLYAFIKGVKREKDIDDLRSVFSAKHTLNLGYIVAAMIRYTLKLPKALEDEAPSVLRKL